MKQLEPLTIDTAPDASKPTLEAIQKGFGFIPNLMATFAHSPSVLNGYIGLDDAWTKSSLTPKERQVILLAASVENNCRYCIAAHSTTLKGGMKVSAETVLAIREKKFVSDVKLEALTSFTREIVAERGYVSEGTKEKFLAAGYSEVTMMEVLVGVALKTISNYLDHLNPTPIDKVFQVEA